MTLVGKKAPFFNAPAVINGNQIVVNFSLEDYLGKQNVLLFFYPKDFTFVCPTELYGLQQRIEEFEQRNVAVVGCSTDTAETHWAWLHVDPSQGGIRGVNFPLVADTSKTIAANFGVLAGNWYIDDQELMQFQGDPVAQRGIFLIDQQGIIRHMLINDLPLGRSIDEIIRTIDMMQHVEAYGEVCPLNWKAGKSAFKPTPQDLIGYLEEQLAYNTSCKTCPSDALDTCETTRDGCATTCSPQPSRPCHCGNGQCQASCAKGCGKNPQTCSRQDSTPISCAQCGCHKKHCKCGTKTTNQEINCAQCGCDKKHCHCQA